MRGLTLPCAAAAFFTGLLWCVCLSAYIYVETHLSTAALLPCRGHHAALQGGGARHGARAHAARCDCQGALPPPPPLLLLLLLLPLPLPLLLLLLLLLLPPSGLAGLQASLHHPKLLPYCTTAGQEHLPRQAFCHQRGAADAGARPDGARLVQPVSRWVLSMARPAVGALCLEQQMPCVSCLRRVCVQPASASQGGAMQQWIGVNHPSPCPSYPMQAKPSMTPSGTRWCGRSRRWAGGGGWVGGWVSSIKGARPLS